VLVRLASAWRGWRERRTLTRRPIPDVLWAETLERYPFLGDLDEADAAQLRRFATLFLADKQFHGTHGVVVSDAMAVAIAAQACLPVLKLGLDWYDGFVLIVVHPDEMLAKREVVDDDGIVHEYEEALTGEAPGAGPMTLSWRDVADAQENPEDGSGWAYNVVIHEFAHVIDMRDGRSDGIPPLPDKQAHLRWREVMPASYERFCREVDGDEDIFMDPYAAEGPDEFFAVACETFFVAPLDLQAWDAPLYELLRDFFGQDPAARFPLADPSIT